jgi:hypothetical protein
VWDHPHKKLPKMEVQTSNLSLPHKKKNPNWTSDIFLKSPLFPGAHLPIDAPQPGDV